MMSTRHVPIVESTMNTAQFLCDTGVAGGTSACGAPAGEKPALIASIAGCCLVFISSAVTNVALASIGSGLGLDAHPLQWIINAEPPPLGGLRLVGGAMGDRFGHKTVFLVGIAVFAVASV